jgi:protein-disulfide isomerase-like protein with CxxC motif
MESRTYWEDVRMTAKRLHKLDLLMSIQRQVKAAGRRLERADHALRASSGLPDETPDEVLEMEDAYWTDEATEITRPVRLNRA